jgi:uncharacterized protein YdiU (UPF0061 family)
MKSFLSKSITSHFENELPADPNTNNVSRQVIGSCYSYVEPKKVSAPSFVHISTELIRELGLEKEEVFAALDELSGNKNISSFMSYAMCYGGHQFGNWAGQLGDGRAINIAEADLAGQNWKFQLKGAGPTPYSRGSDGLAVLRSSIREYLCSEAMHHLDVPSTRALSLVNTGDWVTRDILYNGNPKDEQGAIVCRLSPSFIRFGSFEIFSARRDKETLKKLVDYTIDHHYPNLGEKKDKTTYLQFFKEVVNRTLEMVIHWQRVGFVHGVMNTDNMSILGLTIDYGPYGWLEDYDPNWTPNTTDYQHKRYRYGNQPNIALWNLTQLANALYPLIEEVKPFEEILNKYKEDFRTLYHQMMCSKLGLFKHSNASPEFIDRLQKLLEQGEVDMTLFFREMSSHSLTKNSVFEAVKFSSYKVSKELENVRVEWEGWADDYFKLLEMENTSSTEREVAMKKINPKYVLRNYMAQLAIDEAEKGNHELVDELYNLLLNPYDEQPEMEKWYTKRPEWAKEKVGCSMLSCSS